MRRRGAKLALQRRIAGETYADKREGVMDAKTKNAIRNAFYNYEANRRAAEESLKDISGAGLIANDASLNVVSSKTNNLENQIFRSFDKTFNAFRWFKVIDNTIVTYKAEYKYRIIDCLYFKHWGARMTARRLGIDRSTRFRWKNEIYLTAEFWAQEMGLI